MPATGLGIQITGVSAELAQALGLSSTQGAWVVEVGADSAAARAGVKPMDVLVEIAGQAVTRLRRRAGHRWPVAARFRSSRCACGASAGCRTSSSTIPGTDAAQTEATMASAPVPADPATSQGVPPTSTGRRPVLHGVRHALEGQAAAAHAGLGDARQPGRPAGDERLGNAPDRRGHPGPSRPSGRHSRPSPATTIPACSPARPSASATLTSTLGVRRWRRSSAILRRRSIDNRWADMVKADGGNARLFPWPAAP